MDTIFLILSLIIIIAVSIHWGNILSLKLPELSKWFDRKPFNCRPCLTFHINCILSVLCTLMADSIYPALWGIAAAFIVFLILKYIDNQKIIK